MAGQWLVARALLDSLAEVRLELARLGPEGLEAEAGGGFGQDEGAVAVRAEGFAEVDGAVAGGPRVNERLEHEVLLARLAPEEDGVVAARDVIDDIGVELLELGDDGREVVGGGEGVVLEGHFLHAEIGLGPL